MAELRRDSLTPPLLSDYFLVASTVALVSLSLIMVYSTTGIMSGERYGDALYFLKRQASAALLGIVALVVMMKIPERWLRRFSVYCYPLAFLLLLLPWVPGLGDEAGGAQRWINLGILKVQPAEISKLCFVLFFAGYLGRHEDNISTFSGGILKPAVLLIPIVLLLLLQPDFGSAVVILLVSFVMATAAGVRLRYLMIGGCLCAAALAALVVLSPYRMARVTAFLAPFADESGKGYQLIQSLIAIGTGKLSGVGIGESQQKLFFLPAAHTDFIFAVIAEELGFIGAMVVIALFLVILWRGVVLSARISEDTFLFTCVVGCTGLIVVPAFLNLGVVTGLLPTKGLVLPLVGYGGSSLIASLATIGLLLNLARIIRQRLW
ncbi:MAG: putative lipid II flippase FtsW [Bdellovibrionota bacterium]|nr:MAG: putative lipid II flippase FtsW [Bdellovibrionota bacterium]